MSLSAINEFDDQGSPTMFCTSTAVTPSSIVAAEEVVEQEGETHTPSSSRCLSRQSNRSVGGDTNSEKDDEIHIPAKKSKEETPQAQNAARGNGLPAENGTNRVKFEAELLTTLQQQSSQFQANLMQQNQLFQAELFKNVHQEASLAQMGTGVFRTCCAGYNTPLPLV